MEGDDEKLLLVQSESLQNCSSFGPPSEMPDLTLRSFTKIYKFTLQSYCSGA